MGGGGKSSLSLLVDKERERELKQLHNAGYQGGRIYSVNGLSVAINARANNGYYVDENKL